MCWTVPDTCEPTSKRRIAASVPVEGTYSTMSPCMIAALLIVGFSGTCPYLTQYHQPPPARIRRTTNPISFFISFRLAPDATAPTPGAVQSVLLRRGCTPRAPAPASPTWTRQGPRSPPVPAELVVPPLLQGPATSAPDPESSSRWSSE